MGNQIQISLNSTKQGVFYYEVVAALSSLFRICCMLVCYVV